MESVGGPPGGPVDGTDGGCWNGVCLERLLSEYNYRKKEAEELKRKLRGGYETISESIIASRSSNVDRGGIEGEGDGSRGEEESEMGWNERICFVENLKAELRERRNEPSGEEGSELKVQSRRKKAGKQPCTYGELEHDNGENDRLEEISEDEQSDDEDYGGEEPDSDDDELALEEFEDEEEDEFCDDLGRTDVAGPIEEVRAHIDGTYFIVGSTFADKSELVRAISNYAIRNGVKLKCEKSDRSRIRVKCQKGCPFVLYATKEVSGPGLVVKTLCLEHKCSRVFKNTRASVKWVASHFKKKVQERPQYKISDMKKDLEDEMMLYVSIWKCKRAKKIIILRVLSK